MVSAVFLGLAVLWGLIEVVQRRGGTRPRRELPTGRPHPGTANRQRPRTMADLLAEMQAQARAEAASRDSPPSKPASLESAAVDFDAEAEQVARARYEAAEARNVPLTAADHEAFDRALRQAPEVPRSPVASRQRALQRAMIWREVLAPPKALSDRP